MRRTFSILVSLLFVASAFAATPRKVVLLIGDGMGFEQVKAAGMYLNGAPGTLSFESLPYVAQVTTRSANSSVTDSAAAGTAIATATKVNNGVISVALPGDGHELQTMLEYLKDLGYSTGLITTSYMTDATPAAFGAHEASRSYTAQIAADYLGQTRPEVLFGGGGSGLSLLLAQNAGYVAVTDCATLLALDLSVGPVSAQFGSGQMPYEFDGSYATACHLSQMTAWALQKLDADPEGMFLMVEGGNIDHAGHENNLYRNVYETIEFANTAQLVLNWAAGRTDVLVLVTADHETGGLTVTGHSGMAGEWPSVSWSTTGHTGANVPAYAVGVNADQVTGVLDNTDLFSIVCGVVIEPPPPAPPVLTISPATLTRSVNAGKALSSDTITVQNTGEGDLTYTVTSNVPWLTPSPASGSSTGEIDGITLSYATKTLPVGVYVGTVTVVSPEANNSPQTVTVTLTVKQPGGKPRK